MDSRVASATYGGGRRRFGGASAGARERMKHILAATMEAHVRIGSRSVFVVLLGAALFASGAARVQAPARQDYGASVVFLIDPSGVLFHLCQWDR